MTDMHVQRRAMVDCQLRTNRVTDERLLAAMAETPRERFVPGDRRDLAYVDEEVPLGHGRHLLEPRTFALLAQAAGISESDVVLDIGCGTGYSAAVLGRMARAVVAVESAPALLALAVGAADGADQDNVVFQQGPLAEGWPRQAPYDVILVDGGAVERVPDELVGQLAEGGRLCAVVRPDAGPGRAVLMTRAGGRISERPVFDASAPRLSEFDRKREFVF